MKGFIRVLIALSLASPALAGYIGQGPASTWTAGQVSVSTNTPTLIPASAIGGRTKIQIQNLDNIYSVAIGTSSNVTVSTGYIIEASTSSFIVIDAGSNVPVYGIGQGNAVRQPKVGYMEFK